MNKKEKWKLIKNYKGFYEISNHGNVKSLSRLSYNGKGYYQSKEKILKPVLTGPVNKQYLCVNLCINGFSKLYRVHLLVAQYIPNPHNLPCINHKDGNKLNNNDWNLEWVTIRENACHITNILKTSSKYIGVKWDKSRSKWLSNIYHNNKLKFLGRFDTELEAYQVRCNYEKENNIINKYL